MSQQDVDDYLAADLVWRANGYDHEPSEDVMEGVWWAMTEAEKAAVGRECSRRNADDREGRKAS